MPFSGCPGARLKLDAATPAPYQGETLGPNPNTYRLLPAGTLPVFRSPIGIESKVMRREDAAVRIALNGGWDPKSRGLLLLFGDFQSESVRS